MLDMLPHVLPTAWRHARRHLGTTLLNGIGLALGLTAALLVAAFIRHETTYDRHHPEAERLYRVQAVYDRWLGRDRVSHQMESPTGVVPVLRNDVPGVERVSEGRIFYGTADVKIGETFYEPSRVAWVDAVFFDLFTYERVAGDVTRMNAPGSVTLTTSVATRYFERPDEAVGRTIRVGQELMLEVVAVVSDPPTRTHLPFRVMVSYASREDANVYEDWYFTNGHITYAKLKAGVDAGAVTRRLNAVRSERQEAENRDVTRFYLQPVTTLHTDPNGTNAYPGATIMPPAYLWTLGLIGLLILGSAGANFVNLATAQAMLRAREVGVRKTLGGTRTQLAVQFLGETLLLTGGAGACAFGAAYTLLPALGLLFGFDLSATILTTPLFIGSTVLGTGLVGCVAGAYPALVLAGFRPVRVLKKQTVGVQGTALRRVLIGSQLIITQALLIGTAVVLSQMQYVQEKDLGFSRAGRVSVEVPSDPEARTRFRQTVTQDPAVEHVTFSGGVPGRQGMSFVDVERPGSEETVDGTRIVQIDAHYLATFDIDLLAGRTLRPEEETPPHSRVTLVNRTMTEALGFNTPAEAVGAVLQVERFGLLRIVGVTTDYHHGSLRGRIEPLILFYWPEYVDGAGVALAAGQIKDGLDATRSAFTAAFPDTPFRYRFVDDTLAQIYDMERRVMRAFGLAAGVAIVIACLGLFGLARFAAQRRTQEIGIRKVLGASVRSLMALLTREVALLVGAAFVVAGPVAHLVMQHWLSGFAYRIDLGPTLFIGSGLVSLVVALVAVGRPTWRAARMDPVKALRRE